MRAKLDYKYFISFSKDNEHFYSLGKADVEAHVLNVLKYFKKDPKKMRVLEIGCGAGRLVKHMAQIFGEVYGVDISEEMIRRAKEYCKNEDNVFLYVNSGKDLSMFPDEFFDFIFSYITFQHIPEKWIIVNYVKEAHRILRKGGIFKFQVQRYLGEEYLKTKKNSWLGASFSKREIEEIAKSTGFEIVDMKGEESKC